MKKLIGYVSVLLLGATLAPAAAFADFECWNGPTASPPYTYLQPNNTNPNVSAGSLCAQSQGKAVYDTATGHWIGLDGTQLETSPFGTNYDCPTGQTWASTGGGGQGGCVQAPSLVQPTPTDPQQISSNQIYADCMSKSGANPALCQTNALNETGVSPTNTFLNPGQQTDKYGNPIGTTYTPPPQQPYNPAPTPNGTSAKPLTYTPLEPLPGGTNASYNSLSAYLALVFNILLSIGAMIAVVTLVLGGITYMVSEVVDKKAAARQRMVASIVGLLLLLTCWLILNTINPNLVKFNLPLSSTAGSANQQNAPNSQPISQPNPPNQNQIAACEAQKGCTYQASQGGVWACQCQNGL